MKKWNNAEVEMLDLTATAYGRNPHAREANAGKHPNNGAGGSGNTNPPANPVNPGEETVTPNDNLS